LLTVFRAIARGSLVLRVGRSGCVRSGIGRRQAAPDQDIGAQVGAGGPNQRAALYTHLPKSCLVVPDLVENRTHKHWSEISLDYATVGQSELHAVVAQRLRFPDANQFHVSSSVQWGDGFQWRPTASPFPVRSQFLAMKGCPFEHQRHGSPREFSSEDGERFDLNEGLVFAIFGVEMCRAVISKVHSNHDPKESSYLMHFFF
jgi:hypothetical protein